MLRMLGSNRVRSWATAGAACLLWVGCGGSAPAPTGGTGGTQAPPSAEKTAASNLKPGEVVQSFLEAVRTGKDTEAEQWLTKIALAETKKADLYVAPPGTETAKFEVGEVELVEGGAQVFSTWTDLGDDGKPKSDKIVWLLRNETEGWRIAGMATTVFEGEPPLVLNFEDPADMLHQQRMLEAEIAKRTQPAATQTAVAGGQTAPPAVAGQTAPPAVGGQTAPPAVAGRPAAQAPAGQPAATQPIRK